jgi:hypothetical protein
VIKNVQPRVSEEERKLVRNGKLAVVSRESRLRIATIRCKSTVTSLNQQLVNQPASGAVIFPLVTSNPFSVRMTKDPS